LRPPSLSLMELCGPPRTRTRSPRADIGSAQPVRRSERPAGLDSSAPAPQPKRWGGPPWTFTLLQRSSPGPRAVPPVARQVRRHILSWDLFTLRHSIRLADPLTGHGSLRDRVPRTGFGYPLRDIHHQPSRRFYTPEHPWASSFKVFPSPRSVPLSGAMPSCRYRAAAALPRREASNDWAGYRAFIPRRVRSDTGATRAPAVDTFLELPPPERSPIRPGARFDRGASPLILGRLGVPTRPDLRVSGCE